VTHTHALQQLMPDKSASRRQSSQHRLLIFRGPIVRDIHARGLAAGVQHHFRHMGGADARVREFTLNHGADLVAQGLGHTVLVIFAGALLWHGETSRVNPKGYQKGRYGTGFEGLRRGARKPSRLSEVPE
jgi:hypothetical protein